MMRKFLAVGIIALPGVLWLSCTQERQICLTPKIVNLRAEFMRKATATADFSDSALPSGRFIALTNNGPQGFQSRQQSATALFSLSPDTNFCQWAYRTDSNSSTVFDTLSFYYRRQLHFISNACGYTYFYTLDSAHTTHIFTDSLRVVNSSITNDVTTPNHLQVYIHPGF
jgi:hypothetical protein